VTIFDTPSDVGRRELTVILKSRLNLPAQRRAIFLVHLLPFAPGGSIGRVSRSAIVQPGSVGVRDFANVEPIFSTSICAAAADLEVLGDHRDADERRIEQKPGNAAFLNFPCAPALALKNLARHISRSCWARVSRAPASTVASPWRNCSRLVLDAAARPQAA